MADLDMEAEAAVFNRFEGTRARAQEHGKRKAKDAPAAQHQTQAPFLQHQRHRKSERTEAFAQEIFRPVSSRKLLTAEAFLTEGPCPDFLPPDGFEAHADRRIGGCAGKAHERCRKAREQPLPAFHTGASFCPESAPKIMH